MTDREIFRKNLNDFLTSSGKMQKDLAEYVGAKTTTVSGWTRGISYPRADAMEKIAMFFGVPTSRLVEDSSAAPDSEPSSGDVPHTPEARILAKGIDKMPPAQREAIINMMQGLYPGLFEKGEK